jgi:hypothetical protein
MCDEIWTPARLLTQALMRFRSALRYYMCGGPLNYRRQDTSRTRNPSHGTGPSKPRNLGMASRRSGGRRPQIEYEDSPFRPSCNRAAAAMPQSWQASPRPFPRRCRRSSFSSYVSYRPTLCIRHAGHLAKDKQEAEIRRRLNAVVRRWPSDVSWRG